MKGILIVCFVCFSSYVFAQDQMVVTHKIFVEYNDGKRTKGDILRIDERSIEIRLKSKRKSIESIITIHTDSSDVRFIKSITIARKETNNSTVLVFTITGTAFGFLSGFIFGGGSEEFSRAEVGIVLAIPGLLAGTIFGVAAGFEKKTFPVRGDAAAFENALLEISERLTGKR